MKRAFERLLRTKGEGKVEDEASAEHLEGSQVSFARRGSAGCTGAKEAPTPVMGLMAMVTAGFRVEWVFATEVASWMVV